MISHWHPLIQTDVLVIGGGAAGLRAAIEARRQGADPLILSPFKAGFANNSAISLGGFNATDEDRERGDSPESFYKDSLAGGCGLNRPFLLRILVDRAWPEAKAMEEMGVLFQKDPEGRYIRYGRGGHSVARRLSTPHATGMEFLAPLLKYARKLQIPMLSDFKAVALWQRQGRICGALLINRIGEWRAIAAKSVILAAGGGGSIYPRNSNAPSATGEGYLLAFNAGLVLQDMEFVQFILKHLREPGVPPRLPAIEQLLLDGATLKNEDGEAVSISGDRKRSFTRDALSRLVARQAARGGGWVYLDMNTLPPDKRPEAAEGRSPLVKISPAAHFFMGGVRVDEKLETPVAGLYVAGEVMGGTHGANRLGGNALAEAFVFGALAGKMAARFAGNCGKARPGEPEEAQEAAARLMALRGQGKGNDLEGPDRELNLILGESAGVIRDKIGLARGLDRLETAAKDLPSFSSLAPRDHWDLFNLWSKQTLAEMILRSALMREESRGAHNREDFPELDDRHWAVNIAIQRDEGGMRLWTVK